MRKALAQEMALGKLDERRGFLPRVPELNPEFEITATEEARQALGEVKRQSYDYHCRMVVQG